MHDALRLCPCIIFSFLVLFTFKSSTPSPVRADTMKILLKFGQLVGTSLPILLKDESFDLLADWPSSSNLDVGTGIPVGGKHDAIKLLIEY